MRAVRRALTLLSLAAAVLASTSSNAAATPLLPANCSCGSLYATGNGYVGETVTTGAVVGYVSKGTIWVRKHANSTFHVTSYGKRAWVSSLRAWKFTGTSMYVKASGGWWVKAQGTGVSMSSTAQGTATLEGKGDYYLNAASRPAHWPSLEPRHIQLRG
jgi:hypothetical protein